jgi:hypothetical protein
MSLTFRRAVLTLAKADAGVTAIVAAGQIHPQAPLQTPVFPFFRFGAPDETPRKAAGAPNGSRIGFAMHGFAKPRYDGAGAMIETAEDVCHRMGAAMVAALDGKEVTGEGGEKIRLRWDGTQIMPDGATSDAFHCVVNMSARVLA